MILASPAWLFGLLALPLLVGLEVFFTRSDRGRVARLVSRPLWARVLRRESERWRFFRLAFLLLGLAGLLLALARPQWGVVREKVEREGADVVFVLDSSGSMATADVPPNRFFLARAALLSLVARLEGDRFALVAFEGDAYPLVPLTLDADAVGLFLDTAEPGLVPSPGSSLGQGLARGLDMFVDRERRNKVMVLVSDGEDLEGEIEGAVRKAHEAGVVVHTVGVGTEKGQPVPDLDADGRVVGFKKDEAGQVVVSRLNEATLEAIARGTGGRYFRLTSSDPSLVSLAAAIEGMEEKALAREYAYRRKERYQWPLAFGLGALSLALGLPLPSLRRRPLGQPLLRAAAALGLLALGSFATAQVPAPAPTPGSSASPPAAAPGPGAGAAAPTSGASPAPPASRVLDEVLLRPRRLTEAGRRAFERGDHPESLRAFEGASTTRPADPGARFNLADGLYKNGKFDEAAALYRDLGRDPASPLAAPSRFNLGNTLFQKQDYKPAIDAYRDALRLRPDDPETRRNLEMALRALQKQQEQKQKQPPPPKPDAGKEPKPQPSPGSPQNQPGRPQTKEERERQRFETEAGMPKERAEQLLDALQRNEKAEQRKALLAKRREKKGKDW
jgi:Ca-activated chloride channel family protein